MRTVRENRHERLRPCPAECPRIPFRGGRRCVGILLDKAGDVHVGWTDLIYTHISARVPGPDEHFLLNPLGWMFEEVTASSLVKVDIRGRIVTPTPHRIHPA